MARIRGWHKENIKAELRKRFGTLRAVGTILGVDLRSVSGALNNPLASIVMEKRIAELLEVRPHTLWPDRWQPNGSPISRRDRLQHLEALKRDAT